MDLPKNLESYYQETGRAGRDGLPAEAWMVWSTGDAAQLRRWIHLSDAPEEQKAIEGRKLDALLDYCRVTTCRRQVLLRYFGESHEPCGNCDVCLGTALESPEDLDAVGVETFDATEPVRKLLSCVHRTGQRFSSRHVINVLLGRATEEVVAEGHDQLSTFGIGKELTLRQWRDVSRQVVQRGHLHTGPRQVLSLGPDLKAILRGEQKVVLQRRRERAARTGWSGRAGIVGTGDIGRVEADVPSPEQSALFDALRRFRKQIATAQGLPPYVIFHDTTLLAMAREQPRTLEAMGRLQGVGAAKLARYGNEFLEAIAKHLAES